jgi:hypothetical protein
MGYLPDGKFEAIPQQQSSTLVLRHAREAGIQAKRQGLESWIGACAGMT